MNLEPNHNDKKGEKSIDTQKKFWKVDEEKFQAAKKTISESPGGIECLIIDENTKQNLTMRKMSGVFTDLDYARSIVRSISMLKFFDHENILKVLDIIKPETETNSKDILMITEHMEGSLYQVIFSKKSLSNDHIQDFIYQLLLVTLYLHSADVIHRDFRPSLLLMNKECLLKISSFQWARSLSGEGDVNSESVLPLYCKTPEMLLFEKHGKPVDIWAIGCILTELLGRAVLFTGKDYLDQLNKILEIIGTPEEDDLGWIQNQAGLKYIKSLPKKNRTVWKDLFPDANPDALDLLDKMLVWNPEQRPTAQECLNHPFFQDIYDADDLIVCNEKFVWKGNEMETSMETLKAMIYGGSESSSQ